MLFGKVYDGALSVYDYCLLPSRGLGDNSRNEPYWVLLYSAGYRMAAPGGTLGWQGSSSLMRPKIGPSVGIPLQKCRASLPLYEGCLFSGRGFLFSGVPHEATQALKLIPQKYSLDLVPINIGREGLETLDYPTERIILRGPGASTEGVPRGTGDPYLEGHTERVRCCLPRTVYT